VERAAGRNLVSFDYSFLAIAFPSCMSITFGIAVRDDLERGWVEVIGIYLVILNIIWRPVLVCRT
jgi:tellurite resistance protein TehA-like permease